MEKLKKLRAEIDDIDKQIVKLIENRMKVSVKVGELKKENNIPVFDAKREKELIEEVIYSYIKSNLSEKTESMKINDDKLEEVSVLKEMAEAYLH